MISYERTNVVSACCSVSGLLSKSLTNGPSVWIDVMLRHKIAVEVCRVEEEGYQPRQKKAAAPRKSVGPKGKAKDESEDEQDEENFDVMDVDADVSKPSKSTPSRSQPPRKRPFAEVTQ